jgi:hypothetical protein
MDLAIGAGDQLLVVHGRDRKLSLDGEQQAKVLPARTEAREIGASITSLVIGDFAANHQPAVAVLTENGDVKVINPTREQSAIRGATASLSSWQERALRTGSQAQANTLVRAKTSSASGDGLLLLNQSGMQIISTAASADATPVMLESSARPVAALSMRLNSGALSDVTMLISGKSSPIVMPTELGSTFVVTNTNSSGAGSLQFAILDANETPGADLITFNIPGTSPFTINQSVPLPSITDPVTIDGTSQPGFSGTPIVAVSGTVQGLIITGGSSTVRALVINTSPSIRLQGAGGNIIEGNFVGRNFSGTALAASAGIELFSSNNTVGGTVAAARNLFGALTIGDPSGNFSGNLVQGNYLGTDVTGTLKIDDGLGITIRYSNDNTVGGTATGARNVIAGRMTASCVSIGNVSSGNLIQGNYIGTDVTGTVKLTASSGGVSVVSAANTLGGTTPAARNVISGNQGVGVNIGGGETHDILVQGNYIGTNAAGTAVLGNGGSGIEINTSAYANAIGGVSSGARNLISGNSLHGILITGGLQNQVGNQIQGNYIGTDVTGTTDFGNGQNGIAITGNSPSTVIGGTTPGAGNVISGNGLSGVLLEGAQVTSTIVQGNFIGTNGSGSAAIGNDLNGVTTSQAPNNTIGGSVIEARNIISANARHGISIGIDTNSGAAGITVRNNYIGTGVTGSDCLGNGRDGVFVNRGSANHTITENLITCNGRDGVNVPNFATNDPGIQIQVVQNSIYANASLGIDLGDPGITANDPQDTDGGANLQQNFPVLTSSTVTGAAQPGLAITGSGSANVIASVNGTLNSTPNTAFTVHWYFHGDAQCTNNQAATQVLDKGKVPVTTDGSGNGQFNLTVNVPVGVNSGVVNCTATDPQGNTSEFSACLPLNTTPPPTPTPIQLLLDTSGPAADQAAAMDSILFLRDPFPVVNTSNTLNQGSDKNTRVVLFVTNLQLAQGETASAVVVRLIDVNNQTHDVAAEDVRIIPILDFTQVIFRLPNGLPAGTCTVKVLAHSLISNAGTIRISS